MSSEISRDQPSAVLKATSGPPSHTDRVTREGVPAMRSGRLHTHSRPPHTHSDGASGGWGSPSERRINTERGHPVPQKRSGRRYDTPAAASLSRHSFGLEVRHERAWDNNYSAGAVPEMRSSRLDGDQPAAATHSHVAAPATRRRATRGFECPFRCSRAEHVQKRSGEPACRPAATSRPMVRRHIGRAATCYRQQRGRHRLPVFTVNLNREWGAATARAAPERPPLPSPAFPFRNRDEQ